MRLRNQNLLDVTPDKSKWLLFTANSTIKSDGSLVMGAGIAGQVAQKYPWLPYELGKIVSAYYPWEPYHILWESNLPFIPFQTKKDWRSPSELQLIADSLQELYKQALAEPYSTFHLNMPGVGYGKLTLEVVIPLVAQLPDNVFIYTLYPESRKII